VYRIIARLLASAIPIDSTEGKKYFQEKATALMDKKNPAIYNQAIMDLGATICKPKNPLCLQCPWHKYCKAFSTKTVEKFPIKSKKLIIKKRHFHYLVFDDGKHLYIRKRIGNDIWKDLHEFALIETDDEKIGISFDRNPSASVFQQQLTHQKITAYFYVMLQKVLRKTITEYGLEKVAYENLENYAMPKVILDFLHQNKYL
jgi:A/G-specific adenine glycosylase